MTQRYSTRCLGGIDQSGEAASLKTCADARNVWAPNGRVEKRPGVLGLGAAFWNGNSSVSGAAPGTLLKETAGVITDISATGNVNSLAEGSFIYFGYATIPTPPHYGLGASLSISAGNSNDMDFYMEYWNGDTWAYLPAQQVSIAGASNYNVQKRTPFLPVLTSDPYMQFVWPQDLAQTTVGGFTQYFFRVRLVAVNGSTAFDALVTISGMSGCYDADRDMEPFLGMFVTSKSGGRLFFNLVALDAGGSSTTNALAGFKSGHVEVADSANDLINVPVPNIVVGHSRLPIVYTIVPESEELFFVAAEKLFYVDLQASNGQALVSTTENLLTPKVETRDFAVGDNAPYAPDFIAQRADFPAAHYVLYHSSRLWMADKSKVMWGAPYPYHRVLPLLSEEPVGTSDEGDITGLSALGEHVVVFKQRATYIMVFEGLNAFNLAVYRPIKVANIGCVSNASIKKIGNELVFLAEQGLMAFNGQRVRQVSLNENGDDRLLEFFTTLSQGKWAFAAAADWKKYKTYLLSLALDGSDVPNTVLAWDYDKNTFWIWEGFEAQHWIEDFDGRLYFADMRGRVFELGNGNTDHGAAIEAYVKTQRFGALDNVEHKEALRVKVTGENLNRDITVDVLQDDVAIPIDQATGTVTMSEDSIEKVYDTAVYDTDNYTEKRLIEQRFDVRVPGRFFQVKVSHNTKNGSFALSKISLDALLVGD